MKKTELKFVGFGGQGIILACQIIGEAASIHENKFATLTQSYGPESRGSACSAKVIISDETIDYPDVIEPDILIVMSQEGYTKFSGELKPNGVMLIDQDLVKADNLRKDVRTFFIPATKLAEELGKKMVANIVMLGFFTAVTGATTPEAMRASVKSSVPPGTDVLNLKAFQMGMDYAAKVGAKA